MIIGSQSTHHVTRGSGWFTTCAIGKPALSLSRSIRPLSSRRKPTPDFEHEMRDDVFGTANVHRWWRYLLMYKCFKSTHEQQTASMLLSQQASERGCQHTTLKPSYLFTRAAAMNLITDKKLHAEKFVLIYAPRRPAAERTGWKRREIWSVIGTGSDFNSGRRINIWMRLNGIKIRERNALFFNK